MNVNEFAKSVSVHEKGDEQVNIAQIMELLKVINEKTHGALYCIIECLK